MLAKMYRIEPNSEKIRAIMSHLTEESMESSFTEAQEGASWRSQCHEMKKTEEQPYQDQGRCAQCKSTVTGDVFFGLGERFCSVSSCLLTARRR
jgi:hypothetical protein